MNHNDDIITVNFSQAGSHNNDNGHGYAEPWNTLRIKHS